ncbi:unnamed protein product, partial [marine sediment metagenome]
MTWKGNDGDTIDIELFDNFEKPMPSHNIADDNPEIVRQLMSVLKNA